MLQKSSNALKNTLLKLLTNQKTVNLLNKPFINAIIKSPKYGLSDPHKYFDGVCFKDVNLVSVKNGTATAIIKNIPISQAYNTGYLMLAMDEMSWIADITKVGIKPTPTISMNLDFVDRTKFLLKDKKLQKSSDELVDLKVVTTTLLVGEVTLTTDFKIYDNDGHLITAGNILSVNTKI